MKSLFKVTLPNGKKCGLSANLTVAVIRLENEYNCKVEVTGLSDDNFGRGIFEKSGLYIFNITSIRKIAKSL